MQKKLFWIRVISSVFAVGVVVAGGGIASPANAAKLTVSDAGTLAVCDGETLDLTHSSGRPLTAQEIDRGTQTVQNYCSYKLQQGLVTPFGTTNGGYVVNTTNASTVTCSCGSYKSWTIKITATGLHTSGEKWVDLIYRALPGSGAWQAGSANFVGPATTYANLPLESGTMSTSQHIQSYGTYTRNSNIVEQVYNSAG
ncbi:hypothetical protein [Microbacterium sp. 18062]|uniref:hypothetical protein n=1 Tax=Microbacterium sp. 18062 TaxID=2681410 RepID=UPI00135764EA|nr:hypothetical protein [Microbacterium sp. 18062]